MTAQAIFAASETISSKGPTRQLAEFAVQVPGHTIPDATLDVIEECILDFVGNIAFAARFAESSPAFRNGTLGLDGGAKVCTVVGESEAYSTGQAVILSGAFAHTMDFDDTNSFGVLHPGAPIISAVLASAEHSDVDGRKFIKPWR